MVNPPSGSGGLRPPPEKNQGDGDRRPRPTSTPTQPPIAIPSGSCNPNDKYYSADGGCNNIDSPNWGNFFIILSLLNLLIIMVA